MPRREGRIIKCIREAVQRGRLTEPFSSEDVVAAGCIDGTKGTKYRFLRKHRVGNGTDTELFVEVRSTPKPALYRLNYELCERHDHP